MIVQPPARSYHRRVRVSTHGERIPIVGLGAGTHAKSLVEALRSTGEFDLVALVDDDPARVGTELLGYPVRGPEALTELRGAGVSDAFAAIGGVGSSAARRAAYARLLEVGFELPPILHEAAIVSPWASLGRGCHVLARAVINAGTEIGENTIVNTGAIIEHDCRVGAHAHVAPGALIAGLVEIEDDAHVGIGAVVIQGIRIGAGALVGAGAVVVDDVHPGARVAGVPARELPQSA